MNLLFEELTKILVEDILIGLNIIIILTITLRFIRKYVLPQIPHWIKEYRDTMLEIHAINKAMDTRKKYE